jgi:hypothetical protein
MALDTEKQELLGFITAKDYLSNPLSTKILDKNIMLKARSKLFLDL